MSRLSSAVLKIKPVRRFFFDVYRCEQYSVLQRVHERYWRARYREDLVRFPGITDVFVISFPKSGRTWHRFALGKYLADLWGRPESEAASVEKLTADRQGTRTQYNHNGANFAHAVSPDDPLVADPDLWRGKKVIFLARDPKDVLVSAWHHAMYRESSYSGPIKDFVRSRYAGIDKILTAHNRWWENRHLASSHIITSYERMHSDLGGVLRETLGFVGWPIDEATIARAVSSASFDAMREAESKKAIDHKSLRSHTASRDSADDRGRKVRSGKVGGHRQHLSPEDIAYIDQRTAALGNPFASYCASPVSPAA